MNEYSGNTAKLGIAYSNIQTAQSSPSLLGSEPIMHHSQHTTESESINPAIMPVRHNITQDCVKCIAIFFYAWIPPQMTASHSAWKCPYDYYIYIYIVSFFINYKKVKPFGPSILFYLHINLIRLTIKDRSYPKSVKICAFFNS